MKKTILCVISGWLLISTISAIETKGTVQDDAQTYDQTVQQAITNTDPSTINPLNQLDPDDIKELALEVQEINEMQEAVTNYELNNQEALQRLPIAKFQCPICKKMVRSIWFKAHVKAHTIVCPICNETVHVVDDALNHLNSRHPSIVCPICDEKVRTLGVLNHLDSQHPGWRSQIKH